MSDAELLEQLQSAPADGMEALLAKYGPLLRYVIGGILRDPQDAEDCFSDVYKRQGCQQTHQQQGQCHCQTSSHVVLLIIFTCCAGIQTLPVLKSSRLSLVFTIFSNLWNGFR